MGHYFFNVLDEKEFVPDTQGMELPNDAAARRQAEQNARVLLAADVLAGKIIDARRVEARDERGGVVTSIFLRDLVH